MPLKKLCARINNYISGEKEYGCIVYYIFKIALLRNQLFPGTVCLFDRIIFPEIYEKDCFCFTFCVIVCL